MLRINLPGVVTDSIDISQFVIGQMDDLVNLNGKQGQHKCKSSIKSLEKELNSIFYEEISGIVEELQLTIR